MSRAQGQETSCTWLIEDTPMDPTAVLADLQELFIKHGIASGTLAIPTDDDQFLLLSHSMTLTHLKMLGHTLVNHPGIEVTPHRVN
jgi:hypothetical protein